MRRTKNNTNPQHHQSKCRLCYFTRTIANALHCLINPPALDYKTGLALWPVVTPNNFCSRFRYRDDNIRDYTGPQNQLPIYRDPFGDYCKIPLTQGRFAKIDPSLYCWLAQFRWQIKTNRTAAYAFRTCTINKSTKRIYMHRLIANTPPHLLCDHINHDGLDNRKQNLRNCTLSQNNANSRPAKNASSKYKGVSWNKKRQKWAAYIKKNGRQTNIGLFSSEIHAAAAYDHAAKILHQQFAHLNFPESPPV